MANVFIKLNSYIQSATPSEKEIINYILNNYREVIREDVRTLAEKTFSSASTIVRMCKKLGYTGFADMKNELIYEVALTESNKKQLNKNVGDTHNVSDTIEMILEKTQTSLTNTSKLQNEEDILQVLDLIENSENINLFGMGSSLLAARDMKQKFLRVGKVLNIDDDWHIQYLFAKNSDPTTLAIIFSYSGNTKEIIDCVKVLKQNSSKIVAITGFLNSYVAKNSDIILQVAPSENIPRPGAFSSRISQLHIIDILYNIYIHRHYDKYMEKLSDNFIGKEDENDGKLF
ncbi:MurR/RpiR family transcriptional regulator [Anaerococcus sp. Marseille-P3915]|uniref:MurR/RpiR family transcriptional regulator n=1 Tax=Anaerococcus sp. Marseille-P3915 TaxID=2057799 RepID=UPI000D0ABE2E|nr:MurR/RpiR family transcriptional regulator [Anaerococcus sp. Marseille-P3915]